MVVYVPDPGTQGSVIGAAVSNVLIWKICSQVNLLFIPEDTLGKIAHISEDCLFAEKSNFRIFPRRRSDIEMTNI